MIETLQLACSIVLAVFCGFFFVRAGDVLIHSGIISHKVANFVLFPLAAGGPSRFAAVMAAYHNRMATALEFAIGRSMQVALFVTPVLVLASWAMNGSVGMTLHFPILDTIAVFLGVLLMAELCRDGKSDYLEGTMCIITYVHKAYILCWGQMAATNQARYLIFSCCF
jgi:Ca2+:H+ antiporter